MRIDERLKEYATDTQRRVIDAVNQHGSQRAAAKALGVHKSCVDNALKRARGRAVRQGLSPAHDMTHTVPTPYIVKGVSTLYDKDGQVTAQWVKSRLDEAQLEETIKAMVKDMVEEARGLSKLIPPPKVSDEDLLVLYPIGDPHFGMYAWKAEAGEDFDSEIAERITIGAVDRLVASAPPAAIAIVAPMGDVMHADDSRNRTPQSGNQLDVDTRHQRVIMIAQRAIRRAIYRALEKHQIVIGRILQGNHDPHAAFAIAMALQSHFENNPRVKIDLSPAYFWYYHFGKVLIGLTHGDKARGRDLLGVMAADKAVEWGQSQFRYFYHGHLHESGKKEMPGLLIEWFRTLAPADAWAAGEGYRSGRDMNAIVFHKNYGEVGRHTCNVAMLESA